MELATSKTPHFFLDVSVCCKSIYIYMLVLYNMGPFLSGLKYFKKAECWPSSLQYFYKSWACSMAPHRKHLRIPNVHQKDWRFAFFRAAPYSVFSTEKPHLVWVHTRPTNIHSNSKQSVSPKSEKMTRVYTLQTIIWYLFHFFPFGYFPQIRFAFGLKKRPATAASFLGSHWKRQSHPSLSPYLFVRCYCEVVRFSGLRKWRPFSFFFPSKFEWLFCGPHDRCDTNNAKMSTHHLCFMFPSIEIHFLLMKVCAMFGQWSDFVENSQVAAWTHRRRKRLKKVVENHKSNTWIWKWCTGHPWGEVVLQWDVGFPTSKR